MGEFPNKPTQFKKGNVGGGKPKGTIHISTRIQRILEQDFDWKKVPIKNSAELQKRYGKDGWTAIIYVAIGKAISGDVYAREWLSKTAYGTKLDITSGGEKIIPAKVMNIKEIKADASKSETSRDSK